MISEKNPDLPKPGWSVGSSIILELDLAISVLCGGLITVLTEEFDPLLRTVSKDQMEDLADLLPQTIPGFQSQLETFAWLSGVLFEEDYATATRAIQQLSVTSALEQLTGHSTPEGNEKELLVDAIHQMRIDLYRSVGIEGTTEVNKRDVDLITASLSFLRDEPRALDFWRWLDRFYYTNYLPWRESRQTLLVTQRQLAVSNLGAADGEGIPRVDWLSEKNPIRYIPGLNENVKTGNLSVFFWNEPFGMADIWTIFPGMVSVSFATPGALFDGFFNYAEQLAIRLQALSDPTRLVILRLIRNMGMNNTDMADYLKLARPTVSIHARILREAGLIHTYAEGRAAKHQIDGDSLRALFKDLERFLDLQ